VSGVASQLPSALIHLRKLRSPLYPLGWQSVLLDWSWLNLSLWSNFHQFIVPSPALTYFYELNQLVLQRFEPIIVGEVSSFCFYSHRLPRAKLSPTNQSLIRSSQHLQAYETLPQLSKAITNQSYHDINAWYHC
jgi:hypothetical protein